MGQFRFSEPKKHTKGKHTCPRHCICPYSPRQSRSTNPQLHGRQHRFRHLSQKIGFHERHHFPILFRHATCHRPFRKNMSEIEYMKECMARDLVVMLVDEQKMSLHGALDALYQSETYAKLKDTRSGLYFRLRLRILAQGDIDRQDVTKEYTKNVLR